MMFGATEPSARATEQVKQPVKVARRHPNRLTNTPMAGPRNRNVAKVTELTHAIKMIGIKNIRNNLDTV